MEDRIDTVYVRFDKSLDYMSVCNSFPIKKFLESAFGNFPHMISPKNFTFDRDRLGEYIQNQYDLSKSYIIESRRIPFAITEEYYDNLESSGEDLTMEEFEPETLLDDHIVTINKGGKVLGVFATADDFEHIVNEINKNYGINNSKNQEGHHILY